MHTVNRRPAYANASLETKNRARPIRHSWTGVMPSLHW